MTTEIHKPASTGAVRSPHLFLITTAILALVLSTLPYVIGYVGTPSGEYLWAGTSPSDFGVYLAWMRAAADGSLRDPHLFAGGHPGMLINPVYLAMGIVSRLPGLTGAFVYHVSRIAFGALLLYVLWRFVRLCSPDTLVRRLAFLFLCFSSGFGWCLGWLPLKYWSIDRWQPEAFTFLSLYSYPHFCVALILQVSILGLLVKAVSTERWPYALAAGVCGCLLAIIHTYDIITVACIWFVYALAQGFVRLGDSAQRARSWSMGIIAGLLTAPGIAYIYMAMRSDRVFAARIAEPTLSAPLYTVLIGYGGVLLLAIVGTRRLFGSQPDAQPRTTAFGLLPIWAIINLAVSYFPVIFQRKMLQGEHVALCVLAAVGAAYWLRRRFPDLDWGRLRWPEVALTAFLSVGSLVYLYHDTRDILAGVEQGRYRSTLTAPEVDALAWVRKNTPPGAVVQPVPFVDKRMKLSAGLDNTVALFTPGLTGRAVYAGHWAETPDFDQRIADVQRLTRPSTIPKDTVAALDASGIAYFIYSETSAGAAPAVPVYMRLVYANQGAAVYMVDRRTLTN